MWGLVCRAGEGQNHRLKIIIRYSRCSRYNVMGLLYWGFNNESLEVLRWNPNPKAACTVLYWFMILRCHACRVESRRVMSCYVVSCHVASCGVVSCRVGSRRVVSRRAISYHHLASSNSSILVAISFSYLALIRLYSFWYLWTCVFSVAVVWISSSRCPFTFSNSTCRLLIVMLICSLSWHIINSYMYCFFSKHISGLYTAFTATRCSTETGWHQSSQCLTPSPLAIASTNLNRAPTISLGSHQNIGLHTGARANVVLLTYLLTYLNRLSNILP